MSAGSGRLEAQPGSLSGGASRAGQLGFELAGFRSRLASVSGLASAAGAAGAQAAIGDSCRGWSSAIEALEQQAAGLDRNLQAAATAYAETEESAMPTGR